MSTEINCTPEFIKQLRKSLGLTQESLAKRLGVSFASVNRWENGRTKPIKLAELQIILLYQTECIDNKNTL